MIRSAALRSRRPASARAELHTTTQDRQEHEWKSDRFVRQVDKKGETYWKRKKQHPAPKVRHNLFQASDLLLDLDADGAQTIRPFDDDKDGRRLTADWALCPERVAVRERLRHIEEQVDSSRARALATRLSFAGIWRVNSHDILSAALTGAPAPTSEPLPARGSRDSRGVRIDLRTMGSANGIPPHAFEDDGQLLHWMLRRQRAARALLPEASEPMSNAEFAEALGQSSDVTYIRRLVFLAVSHGLALDKSEPERDHRGDTPSLHISNCLDSAMAESTNRRATALDVLCFIGNLSESISQSGGRIGAPLCGLALMLSAEVADLEATSEWLYQGFKDGAWNGPKTAAHVAATLDSYRALLRDEQATGTFRGAQDRQVLCQLLNGLAEQDHMAPTSLRGAVMNCVANAGNPFPMAMYESYLLLQAQLGGGRLLWAEWRVSGSDGRRRPERSTAEAGQGAIGEAAVGAFKGALCQLVQSIAPSDDDRRSDLSMAECAWLDYHAIAAQEPNAWRAAPDLHLSTENVVRLLGLPLDQFVQSVRQLRAETCPPPAHETR
ncbi:hypothetical protein CDD83_915 [Cordyceps sp. RAO-2017]|nr:hypothetical protein CDD83_915 [Cordyceps sp. RAO-2017]